MEVFEQGGGIILCRFWVHNCECCVENRLRRGQEWQLETGQEAVTALQASVDGRVGSPQGPGLWQPKGRELEGKEFDLCKSWKETSRSSWIGVISTEELLSLSIRKFWNMNQIELLGQLLRYLPNYYSVLFTELGVSSPKAENRLAFTSLRLSGVLPRLPRATVRLGA